MTEEKTTGQILAEVINWLDDPQTHLGDAARRKVIEVMISDYVSAQARREAQKSRVRDVLLYGGLIGMGLTLIINSAKVWDLL